MKKQKIRENTWPGWDKTNGDPSEPKEEKEGGREGEALSQRAGCRRNRACRKVLVSYTQPHPQEEKRVPTMPHPPASLHSPQQHLSAPSLLPAMPG